MSPVHIIPVGDLIEHERDPGCVCGPAKTLVARAFGPEDLVEAYAHMSLDGREHRRVAR